jgi:iron complex outermembrane receptor protein
MKTIALLCAASATALASGAAHAQQDASAPAVAATPAGVPQAEAAASPPEADQAIVVTAQRRQEQSRDVPISITSIAPAQLATANITQLTDISRVTPGLRFDFQGASVQPTIRGVGTAITTSGGGPNVGIYVDGFFQPNSYVSNFELLNVKDIEVLKGPQGTLFGRNTTGGAILVTTADPSTTTGGEFRLRFGRFDTVRAQGYLTFGITDRIAVDLESLYDYGNGFQVDRLRGDGHVGQYRNYSVRAGVKAELSDDVSVLLRYTHAEKNDPTPQLVNAYVDRNGGAGFFDQVSAAGRAIYGRSSSAGLPLVYYYAPAGTYATRPNDVALDQRVSFRTNSDIAQGTIKADLGFASLTSYTQYRDEHSPYYGDLDATALPFFGINVPVVDKTFSQEILLNSKPGKRLQWTAGLNYFQYRDTWDVNASFGGAPFGDFGGSSTRTKSYAGFADGTYELTDRLFLTGGLRYSHDIVDDAYFKTNFTTTSYPDRDGQPVSTIGLPPETVIPVQSLKNDSVTPRVVLRYKPSTASSVYASYSRGYKAGILNVGGISAEEVKPEHINAYEVGYKYADRVFSIDLAGYYYDYKNLQVSSYQDGSAQIRNAASSRIYGAEAQARYKVTSAFTLNAGGAWTHARYRKFENAPYYSYCDPGTTPGSPLYCAPASAGTLIQSTVDASGFKMQRAPDWTANAGASYGLPLAGGELMLSGNVYYSSSFYFDPAQQFRQKGYEVLALRTQWTDRTKKLTVAAFGDNVTNRRYRTQVLFNTLGIGGTWSEPATWGVELGVRF